MTKVNSKVDSIVCSIYLKIESILLFIQMAYRQPIMYHQSNADLTKKTNTRQQQQKLLPRKCANTASSSRQ